MAANLECPGCKGAVARNAVRCGRCGRSLGAWPVSSPPKRTRTLEVPQLPLKQPTPSDRATARFTVPLDAHTVPRLRAGLDIAVQPLQPFEAHVASFIDGVQSVPELARSARLPEIEVKVVLKALLERGVVELHRAPGEPSLPSPSDDLPVLDGNEFLTPEPMALGDE